MSYAAFFLQANPIGPAKPDPVGHPPTATGGDAGVDLCLEDLSSADRYENLSHGNTSMKLAPPIYFCNSQLQHC